MPIRSLRDLTRSKVKKGDLVLRVDNPNSAFLTVFDKFAHLTVYTKDFEIKLGYINTKKLGQLPKISTPKEPEKYIPAIITGKDSKFYYGDKAKITKVMIQEGFIPHTQILFPGYFRALKSISNIF